MRFLVVFFVTINFVIIYTSTLPLYYPVETDGVAESTQ